MTQHEWIHTGKPPRRDDLRTYEVWLGCDVRRVRRAGNHSSYLTPGTLAFVDCWHPLQNVVCDEARVRAWRLTGGETP